MSKAYLVMDMPKNCLECPFRFNSDRLSLGDFKYQQLHRCRLQPDGVEEVYMKDIIHKRQDWCQLKQFPEKKKENALSLSHLIGGIFSEYSKGWNDCIDVISGGNADG